MPDNRIQIDPQMIVAAARALAESQDRNRTQGGGNVTGGDNRTQGGSNVRTDTPESLANERILAQESELNAFDTAHSDPSMWDGMVGPDGRVIFRGGR